MYLTNRFSRIAYTYNIKVQGPGNLNKALALAMKFVQATNPSLSKGVGSVESGNQAYGHYDPNKDDFDLNKASTPVYVNVNRIQAERMDDLNRLLSEASTIIHEMTHHQIANKNKQKGIDIHHSESQPIQAQNQFMSWVKSMKNSLLKEFPELQHMS